MNAPARVVVTRVLPRIDAPRGAEMLGRLAAAIVMAARHLVAPEPRAAATQVQHRHEPARPS